MLLVSICWTHVEVTFQMYPRCNWWIHWGKNDPEPAMYPGCSHWFPGHLAPSITSPPVSPLLGASWKIKRAGRLNVGGREVRREIEITGRRSWRLEVGDVEGNYSENFRGRKWMR